jgi:SAM-dependent methyltransferase
MQVKSINLNSNNNYFIPIQNEILSLIQFKNVLDIGCKNGDFSINLKKRTGCSLSGLDSSQDALDQAKEAGFDEVYLVTDFCADRLPFPDKVYDFILCHDLIEHLLFPDTFVKNICSRLKKGGYFLASVPNHFNLYGRIKFLFTNDIDTFGYFPGLQRWEFPHIRFFTYDSLAQLFKSNGFSIVKNLSHHFFCVPLKRFLPFKAIIAKKLVQKWPSQFSEGLIILFRKG